MRTSCWITQRASPRRQDDLPPHITLQVTLGLDDEDVADAEGRSFGQLGGDSLAAIQFARMVSEVKASRSPHDTPHCLPSWNSLGPAPAWHGDLLRQRSAPALQHAWAAALRCKPHCCSAEGHAHMGVCAWGRQACGINLPVAYVLDHSHSLAAITQHVQELVRWAAGSVTPLCLLSRCRGHPRRCMHAPG